MNPSERAKEQGVALLMTLGVLSLILILAMSFSFTARSGRQLAQNNAEVVRARLLARSGLERVIAALSFRYDEAQMAGTERLYPATAPAGTFNRVDYTALAGHPLYGYRAFWTSTSTTPDMAQLESALAVQLGMGTSAAAASPIAKQGFIPRAEDFAGLTGVGLDKVSWFHVTAPEPWVDSNSDDIVNAGEYTDRNGSGSWDGCLIGRTTFLVLDESGKLDPGALLTVNYEPVWDRANYTTCYYDLDASGAVNTVGTAISDPFREFSGSIPRRGLSPQEIILPLSGADLWDKVPTVGTTTAKSTWFDWRQIASNTTFSAANWTAVTASTINDPLRIYFPYSYDIEAYRYDLGSGETDCQRFDIWSVDWDTMDPATLSKLYDPTGVETFWTSPGAMNAVASTSAPALGGFRDDGTNDISLQVLANLVDFCDGTNATDSEKATYIDKDGDGALSEGDIFGLDKTPYINEIAFTGVYSYDDNSTPADFTDDKGTILLSVYVELVNMFEVDRNIGNCDVEFVLQYRATGDPTYTTIALSTPTPVPLTGATTAVAHRYVTLQATPGVTMISANAPKTINLQVHSCKITLKNSAGEVVDFAAPISAATPLAIGNALSGVSAFDMGYGSAETNDPRCNTKEADWTAYPGRANDNDVTLDMSGAAGGTINNAATAAAASDAAAGDPTNVCSAYIANTPRITFWELGAVHRGEPWRTINLTKYSSSTSRDYAAGDAILLDQLKLGGFAHVQGRVNANSADPFVWASALNQIKVGWAYTDAQDGSTIQGAGTALTSPGTLGTAIATYTQGGAPFSSRAEIANLPEMTDGTGGAACATDAEQEEIIAKIANLLTVRQNLFTVLVTAQTVLDTGSNNPDTSNSVEYATGKYCTIQSEQKILATVYRDALANTVRVVRLEYLED